MSSYDRIAAAFAFSPFSRIQARRAGIGSEVLSEMEAAGLLKFIHTAGGPTAGSDGDIFRLLA